MFLLELLYLDNYINHCYDRQRLGHSKQMSLGLATTSTPSTGLLVLLLKETMTIDKFFVLLTIETMLLTQNTLMKKLTSHPVHR